MNRVLLILGVVVFLLGSCKKSDSPVSAEEDLRSGTWIHSSWKKTVKDPITLGDSTVDYVLDDCSADNHLIFQTNFDGYIDLGTVHCSTGEPSTQPFTWQITNNEQHISLYHVADFFQADNVEAEIVTRTLGYLTLKYSVITLNPLYNTSDTVIYTDVLRKL